MLKPEDLDFFPFKHVSELTIYSTNTFILLLYVHWPGQYNTFMGAVVTE